MKIQKNGHKYVHHNAHGKREKNGESFVIKGERVDKDAR